MGVNISNSSIKTNSFGGLNVLYPKLVAAGIPILIDQCLGPRVKQSLYSYSEIIMGHILSIFSGGQRLEHAQSLKRDLDNIPGVIIPSSDTTSRIMRSLAAENINICTGTNVQDHLINLNWTLLDLLVKAVLQLKLIHPNGDNVLDYDNTILENKKWDCTPTYKKRDGENIRGYQPGFASLNGYPIFVEGRSGHSTAQFQIGRTLIDCIEHLKKNGIRVTRFRADSASYNKETFSYCDENKIDFFIRKRKSKLFLDQLDFDIEENQWKEIILDDKICHCCSIDYTLQGLKKSFRVVCLRKLTRTGESYSYSGIITNNKKMTDIEVVHFYNMRGAEEKRFAELKNEFNLSRIPFSYLAENTVFLIINCLAYNVYRFLIQRLAAITEKLNPATWLRKFRQQWLRHTLIINNADKYAFTNLNDSILKMFRKWYEEF